MIFLHLVDYSLFFTKFQFKINHTNIILVIKENLHGPFSPFHLNWVKDSHAYKSNHRRSLFIKFLLSSSAHITIN